ncbi:MAG: PEP-CTERM sorting domain-containing protein [Syntrophobacter sp.]
MRKSISAQIILITAMTVMLWAPAAMSDTITIKYGAYYSGSGVGAGGGEFLITGNSGALQGQSFLTFCLEKNEYFYIGGTYDYKITDAADAGGAGGPSPDPLSVGSAYLYYQFVTNQLGTLAITSSTLAGQFQEAIWYLENEITSITPGNPYYDLATKVANYSSNANGAYGVYVLNLTDASGKHQDQLVCVPESSTLLLLGAGLLFVAAYRKRYANI